MACIIAAPSSNSGKTLLTLVLISWARLNNKSIQTFKVGPDYLDPQLLTAASNRPCRNLDLNICKQSWVRQSFFSYGGLTDLAIVEGVMGLFDGLGSSSKGSTSDIAQELDLPIVLTINARGQAASLAALVKGFLNHAPHLKFSGVVVNQVNTERHKDLLKEVLDSIDVKMLGSLPKDPLLSLESRYLGLNPAHELIDLNKKLDYWAKVAEQHLDLESFQGLLKAPSTHKKTTPINLLIDKQEKKLKSNQYPIAIAQDKAFHFRYPEVQEYLEAIGMPIIYFKPLEDETIPNECKGLILPGGFPEQYAEQISNSTQALNSIKSFFGKHPIYAECGGMLILGSSLTDLNGIKYPMAGILPFEADKGNLEVGYRQLKSLKDSLILKKDEELIGHEFHYWKLKIDQVNLKKHKLTCPWKVTRWNKQPIEEGWSGKNFHASWIHLHWPSSENIFNLWISAVLNNLDN